MIAGSGIDGVLITSPVVAPTMIDRLVALNARAKGLMVTADDPANVAALAGNANQILGVMVEFDVGQGRTGTRSVKAAVTLARRVKSSPHLLCCGIQACYGHLQHIATYAERGKAANIRMAPAKG